MAKIVEMPGVDVFDGKEFSRKFEALGELVHKKGFSYAPGRMDVNGNIGSFNQSMLEREQKEYLNIVKFNVTKREHLSKLLRRPLFSEKPVIVAQLDLRGWKEAKSNIIEMSLYGKENMEAVKNLAKEIADKFKLKINLRSETNSEVVLGIGGNVAIYSSDQEE